MAKGSHAPQMDGYSIAATSRQAYSWSGYRLATKFSRYWILFLHDCPKASASLEQSKQWQNNGTRRNVQRKCMFEPCGQNAGSTKGDDRAARPGKNRVAPTKVHLACRVCAAVGLTHELDRQHTHMRYYHLNNQTPVRQRKRRETPPKMPFTRSKKLITPMTMVQF
jgi:hypothetical protein